MKKIILAPDSFKGSLSSSDACDAMAAAIEKCGDFNVLRFPMADGGEGTLDVLISALGGKYKEIKVSDPLGRPICASFGICGRIAIIESARACGLPLLDENEKDPLLTTTYGVGQLVSAALDENIEEIYLTLGGSSTNDCGTGFLSALGVKFYGDGLSPFLCGGDLDKITSIDMSGLDERLKKVKITAVCDVENPLFGKNGAAYVFAPQKGADEKCVKKLDDGLRSFAKVVENCLDKDISSVKGAGAAGGLGAALSLLGTKMQKGCEMILSLVDFDSALCDCDLVLTGEGSFDSQSFMGKVVGSIYGHANEKNIPVAVFAGKVENFTETDGLSAICITPEGQNLDDAMKNASINLYNTVLNYIEKNSAI